MPQIDAGFSTTEVARATGLSVRRVAYWTATRLVVPSVADTSGTGNHRRYSVRDVYAYAVLGAMRDRGVSLQALRLVQRYLHECDEPELQNVHARIVGAPGNSRDIHENELFHSDCEIISLLTEPGQHIVPSSSMWGQSSSERESV